MKQGEIYKLKQECRRKYYAECYNHPFVYWKEKNADYTGIMLTTSDNPKYGNIELEEGFFTSGYKIVFGKSEQKNKSFIAPLYLLKDVEYEHLEKVGELSEEGISFIREIVPRLKYTDWRTHMRRLASNQRQ